MLKDKFKIKVSENQLKVITDKYLKDSPTVEDWVDLISGNIALGDIINTAPEEEMLADVTYKKIITNYPQGNTAKTFLLHEGLNEHNKRNDNFKKFLANLYKLSKDKRFKEIYDKTHQKFYNLLGNFEFLPNSPCLMNAGRPLQQLSACFKGDQQIMTREGIKNIIDVKENDMVLTASGKFKRVTKTMERFVDSYRIIDVWKMPNQTLAVTDEHPILCLNEDTNKPEWKFACDITTEDYAAVSYPKETKNIEKLFAMDFLDKNNYTIKEGYVYKINKDKRCPKLSRQIKPIKNEIIVDYDLMRLFGYYLSEGDMDGEDGIRFTFNSSEIEYMKDVINLMNKKFGLNSRIIKSNFGNWSNIKFFSRILVKFFVSILGKGFNRKFIPTWILELPKEKQKGLIIGIFRGDGYPIKNGRNTNIRLVLSNQNLVYGVWVILARLGLLANFKKDKISRLATTNPYKCVLGGYNAEKIFDEIFINKKFTKIIQISSSSVMEKYIDGIFFLPVKKINIVIEPIKVYNFEVEEEHTYVANNISVHNCFVLDVRDSIEEIYDAVKRMALIQRSGGGTGFDFSKLRPANDEVMSTKGISSGPVTFMQIFDKSTEVVRQGGQRRGANMGILRYDHPNIMDFINMKKTPGVMENFNVSVAIDKKFMDTVKQNKDYDLINPRTKEAVGKLNAGEVWNEMIKGAWETGDPGYVVIDRINETNSNPTPALGQIASTNPCVTGNTLISTEYGLMKMEDLVKKYPNGGIKIVTDNRIPIKVMNSDGTIMLIKQTQNSVNLRETSCAFYSGIKPVYKLLTKSGYELEATADHKIFTTSGKKRLIELIPDLDKVLIHTEKNLFEDEVISITFMGEKEVYDLTEPATHSMICNSIVTTQCGEQPLLPNEPCNLASINLSKFVDENKKEMNWEKLKECVFTGVHFLDNVIDVNNYPIPEIEVMAKGTRRIGLGVMGWAETLVLLEISYNSKQALEKAEDVMKFINENALQASCELAKSRGVFPNFKDSIYDKNGKYFRGQDVELRHCARTTIAPTGTIGITAGLQGAGIEPFFAIVYVRYNAAGIDALKEGKKPAYKDTFFEINPLFREVAEKNHFFGLKEQELWKKIEENHKSVVGIKEIPEKIQKLFLTSHDLTALDHVRIQCAFQKYTDNAVSKTVNLRNEAGVDDVKEVYEKAYELGAKGVTIYRDGSKSLQILNLSEKKTENQQVIESRIKSKPSVEKSEYYSIDTGYGPLHVHINYDEVGPTKIFANISPSGTEISGLSTALGIMVSKYLKIGGDPVKLLKHLNSIKGDKPFGFGQKRIDSIPHGISKALREHLIKTGKLKDLNGQTILNNQKTLVNSENNLNTTNGDVIYCPKCFSTNVSMVSGCSEPTCFDCGHSECS